MIIERAGMQIQIISKETIRPSSSTPNHLRTHKLSLLDQLSPPTYVPLILFYHPDGATDDPCWKISHRLKKSLSETLTHFYPLAGRIKDGLFYIDCTDDGVSYTEARVNSDMSTVLEEPDLNQLEKLLPCSAYDISPEISSHVILKTQVNYFNCGGVAISVCIWHAIADGSAAGSFILSWSEIARYGGGGYSDLDGVIFDGTSHFPPQDIRSFSLRKFMSEELLRKSCTKRFLFDSSKISVLRKEVSNGPYLDRATRVEAVAAVIWRAVMDAAGEEHETVMTVNLRKRMDPPFPERSIGNINQPAMATNGTSKDDNDNENNRDCNYLAGKLRESIRNVNDEFVRMIHRGGGYFEFVRKATEEHGKMKKIFSFSSWCRFPFYDADFGRGKPVWVSTALKLINTAIFLDTKDGQGIEAWIGLSKEDMAKFEHNPTICAYASFTPTLQT